MSTADSRTCSDTPAVEEDEEEEDEEEDGRCRCTSLLHSSIRFKQSTAFK
jgi:hypothetical protein